MSDRRAFLSVIEGGKVKRITGHIAAKEYARRYGRSTWVDRSIIDDLREGVLEFDPQTEKIYMAAETISVRGLGNPNL